MIFSIVLLNMPLFSCGSPDNKAKLRATLNRASAISEGPTARTGSTVTRLMLFSCANSDASFSATTFETA